jgi:hypothetical protein
MKSILLASAATVLLSVSLAQADNPLVPNDNDHKAALGLATEHDTALWIARSRIEVVTSSYRLGAAMMPTDTVFRAPSSFQGYRATNGDNK